jgi:hypothetical protein
LKPLGTSCVLSCSVVLVVLRVVLGGARGLTG